MLNRIFINTLVALTALTTAPSAGQAQLWHSSHDHSSHDRGVELHVSTRWKECSFQLHSSLTQSAWRQFAEEAGLVAYFRPLTDARPLGKGKWEVSLLQWETSIDATESAWNDTFVHPDSTHWLFEGRGLKFPGFSARAGVSDRVDVGVYATKNPNANYGFYGGQMQYNFARNDAKGLAASARASFVSLFGPEDLNLTVFGADLLASKSYNTRWVSLSPYVGVSSYVSTAREKSAAVSLSDESVVGARAMLGVAGEFSKLRIGAEYSAARVNSFSLKVGFGV